MRLFVAILLEPLLLDEIGRIQAYLRRRDVAGDVRWVDPAAIHLTLKFLGEVDAASLAGLEGCLGESLAGLGAPRLGLAGLGAFPNLRRPRVLWVGVRQEGTRLGRLQIQVEEACAAFGWEREGRSFQPHLTVGRVRDPGSGSTTAGAFLQEFEAEKGVPATSLLPHGRVALMRSHLSPRGARYEALHVWRLVGV